MVKFGEESSGSGFGPVAMFLEDDNEALVSNNAGNFANIRMCIGLNREYLYDACSVWKFD
jgi:hypothetical protein